VRFPSFHTSADRSRALRPEVALGGGGDVDRAAATIDQVAGAPLAERGASEAFLAWLADPELPDEVYLRGSDHPSTPVLWVLGQLAFSCW
jgi:hypothetical protein